jgi:hypothetical protein
MSLIIKQTGLAEYLEGGSEKIKVLIAGTPGAGKTRLASFSPKPIYADCEGGLMSVADRNVPYGRIKSEQDMNAFLDILRQEAMRPVAQRRWETVVVDTLDKYQRTVIAGYLKRKRKTEMSGWEDWGYLDAAMNHLISTLMELPFNIIVLAHVKETKIGQGDTQRSVLALDLKGAQRDSLPGDFDFVGLLENEFEASTPADGPGRRIKRVIQWEARPNVDWLKARGGGLYTTVASFDTAGYEAIRDGIKAQMANMIEGEVIQEVQTAPEDQEPVGHEQPMPPQAGGPVSTGLARPRGGAQAPGQATLPAGPPAAAQPPRPVTPPPPAKRPEPPKEPEPESDQTMEEGVAVVTEVLQGKVIEDSAGLANAAVDSEPEARMSEPTTAADEPVGDPVEPEPEAQADEGEVTVICGSPRRPDATPAEGVGCGESLTVTLKDGRVVGAQDGQQPGIIDIAALKYRAWLHNACFNKARTAQ